MANNVKNTASSKAGNNRGKAVSRTGTKKPATNSKQRTQSKKEPETIDDGMRQEVILLVILAFSVFLIISNFGKCGFIGDFISGIFFGLFGSISFVLPFYMFLSAAFLIANKFNKKILKKVIYIGVLLGVFSMLCQLVYNSSFVSIGALFKNGYDKHLGGGLLFGGLFFIFRCTIGIIGACIVMFIIAAIMLMLITEFSIIDYIKSLDDYEEPEGTLADAPIEKEINKPKKPAKPIKSQMASKQKNLKKQKPNAKVMNNLNVYDNEDDGPKDFFDSENDIHEIKADSKDFFNGDDAEKIVMHREDDKPVRAKTSRAKTSPVKTQSTVKPPSPAKELSRSAFEDFFAEDSDDDVLAGAVNGNLHPENYDDGFGFAEESVFGAAAGAATGVAGAAATRTASSKTGAVGTRVAAKPTPIAGVKTDTGVRPEKKASIEKSYKIGGKYKFPTSDLLNQPPKSNNSNRDAYVRSTAIKLKNTLENFGVNVTITNYSCGPAVTRFEMQPEQGVKVSKIVGLSDDIKLALAAADIRIEAPIPGKAAIGIEVPNKENSIVAFRELIESDNFKNAKSKIAVAFGKDISGQVIVGDIAKMPHVLIAGSTGSGKSVCINTLIMSILFHARPEDVKLIMVDPKMVELACYNGIPHLLIPVVTDPKKASGALNWAVEEMTRRYQLFADSNVRNLQGYNEKVDQILKSGDVDDDKLTKLPQIVIIVDELADLMMVAHGEVEDSIVRLSQLARAAGIHLVIATQRPSVDVITGLIKANVPSRIAFAVSSGVDSRTILDMNGAEKLLGKGDMLFYPTGYPKPVRVQGAFVSDDEVTKVVDFLKKNNGIGTYDDEISKSITSKGTGAAATGGSSGNEMDDYFIEAGRFIIEKEKASIGMLQRTFKIGFNRAARIMDQLSDAGVVSPDEGNKARKILMSQEQFDQYIEEYY